MRKLPLILLAFALISCNKHNDYTSEMQTRIDSLETKLANTYKPGFGDFMGSLQTHHSKPEGYENAEVKPEAAYYHETLREFVLPYIAVQDSDDPERTLMEFLDTTYKAAATLANWDRDKLEP